MSRNSSGKVSKLESLRLSLSRARGGGGGQSSSSSTTARPGANNTSPRRLSSSSSSSTASPPSSCVSSEGSPDAGAPSMVLSGCPRCMMYVMLSREDPRCPRCHSAVLLEFSGAGEQPRQPRKQRR
ncbi:putative protein TPRXL [Brachypodium distachyon]|uniref:GIR1-like zinc ribbon domain-containing protein n=1 Tax=Brachypodium distachyon TaxID=15368 RepID=I1HTN6_BRADI|nr:putative protein TPRXL [Brachypodium distachyon]KQK10733.1 hypothetical protein BRADI_2g55820v3 [Brachypodium distachyon]|eukprot:XP_003567297.1 putative protein TPRXL [Brachypodium distachyon]